MTCLPGGATDGSVRLGITISIYGLREYLPYLASSYARSMYSIDGEMEMAPRRCGPSPGKHLKFGNASRARFTFPDEPRNLYRLTCSAKSAGRCSLPTIFINVKRGSTLDETIFARISSPFSSTTP